jgi:uncharacterized RDD family membrane protein YckC
LRYPEQMDDNLEYVGFWLRVAATLVDSVLLIAVSLPLAIAWYGPGYLKSMKTFEGPVDLLISYLLPAVAIVLFWLYRQATPGKMLIRAHIVDAVTGGKPSTGQLIGRYFGYFVSMIPLFIGIVWVAFDPRKQGWHDKLARTVVVRKRRQ